MTTDNINKPASMIVDGEKYTALLNLYVAVLHFLEKPTAPGRLDKLDEAKNEAAIFINK